MHADRKLITFVLVETTDVKQKAGDIYGVTRVLFLCDLGFFSGRAPGWTFEVQFS